jgi:LacI family transcriptional regulator
MRERSRNRAAAGKPAGIREMAETLGVSIGTVDRALHDRPGISPATRSLVLGLAEKLGYRPNLAARLLSSRKQHRIAVLFPSQIAAFWDLVRDGVLDFAGTLRQTGVEVVYRPHGGLHEGDADVAQALKEDFQALVLAPGRPEVAAPLIAQAARRGLPVVCVNTDAPGSERLCTVSVDSLASGGLAAELMGRFLGGRGTVVVVTGFESTIDHAEKVEGFQRMLFETSPGIEIAAVVEGHDVEDEAYRKCMDTFAETPDLSGVYVTTANSPPVLRALHDRDLAARVTVITTDLFAELVPHIEAGRIAATIDQRPWIQGQIAFRTMYRYLLEGVRPPSFVRLAPHVVMRSNLSLSLARMAAESAAHGDSIGTPDPPAATEVVAAAAPDVRT